MAKAKRPPPKRPMYTFEQRLAYVKCPCDPKGYPQGADEAAEQKMTGGFNVTPKNICPNCHIAKPKSGVCPYCD